MHEFADVRVYGGENAPSIFAVLYVSSMTKTLTIEWIDFQKFFFLRLHCYAVKMYRKSHQSTYVRKKNWVPTKPKPAKCVPFSVAMSASMTCCS